MIEKLARFCWFDGEMAVNKFAILDYEKDRFVRYFNPLEDANDMMLVEAKLRADGLWEDYVDTVMEIVDPGGYPDTRHYDLFGATLEQRCEAALGVMP